MFSLYILSIISLCFYSFALVDPNFTLINSSLWTNFRNAMVNVGYYQRPLSTIIYLTLVALFFLFHVYFTRKYKTQNPLKLAFWTGLILLFSYPFLSHDFFNYMFDAKILTFYHQNPYIHKALDFPTDSWLRFMHWTHRTYPYGPSWLAITLVPSILAGSKLILNFFFFKLTFTGFYVLAVYLLNKINKKWAVIFATHPLILFEGLVNSHNDLIALTLAIIGIYLLGRKGWLARIFLFISGGIKYITLPLIILSKKRKDLNHLAILAILAILIYLTFWSEIQPWYFLVLFVFLPFYENLVQRLNLFFGGLLVSYYPYIAFSDWNISSVNIKHAIIILFLIINLPFLNYNFLNEFAKRSKNNKK